MALMGKDGVELRLPTHLDLPRRDDEVIPPWDFRVPDHLDLPDSDGELVENFQELPQAMVLGFGIRPILDRLHPDGQYAIGGNSAIYWDFTDPPLRGAIGPDWYYVPGVSPQYVNGQDRRSYVMWKEGVPPGIVMEFVSGDGKKERDRTPRSGKFWIYEQGVRAKHYVIFDAHPWPGRVEVYRLDAQGFYEPVAANGQGRVPIADLGVELGMWQGTIQGLTLPWLRWWGPDGVMLPSGEEVARELQAETRRADEASRLAEDHRHRAEEAARLAEDQTRRADEASRLAEDQRHRAEEAARLAEDQKRRADEAGRRAEALAVRLRALGIDPDEVAGSA